MANFSLPPVVRPMMGFQPGNAQSYDTLSQTAKNSVIVYTEDELLAAITKVKNEIEGPFTIYLGDNILLSAPVVLTTGCEGLIITSLGYQSLYLKDISIPVSGEDFSLSMAFVIACNGITLRGFSIDFTDLPEELAAYGVVFTGVSSSSVFSEVLAASSNIENIRIQDLEIVSPAATSSLRGIYSLGSSVVYNSYFSNIRFSGTPSSSDTRCFSLRSRYCSYSNNVAMLGNTHNFMTISSGDGNIIQGNICTGSFTSPSQGLLIQNNLWGGNFTLSSSSNIVIGNYFSVIPTINAENVIGLNIGI